LTLSSAKLNSAKISSLSSKIKWCPHKNFPGRNFKFP